MAWSGLRNRRVVTNPGPVVSPQNVQASHDKKRSESRQPQGTVYACSRQERPFAVPCRIFCLAPQEPQQTPQGLPSPSREIALCSDLGIQLLRHQHTHPHLAVKECTTRCLHTARLLRPQPEGPFHVKHGQAQKATTRAPMRNAVSTVL